MDAPQFVFVVRVRSRTGGHVCTSVHSGWLSVEGFYPGAHAAFGERAPIDSLCWELPLG